jgi:protein-L-isoaspartate(D-aspartate) O-methyltransferase
MGVAPRERLCPPGRDFLAYAETPVEYAPGRFLMAPRDIAKLLQALKPRPGERALCICAPYAALLLAEIGLSVVALEPADSLEIARKALAETPVEVTTGDLRAVLAGGPYDLVVCEGAVPAPPASWAEALALGGRLGVVERDGPVGKARLHLRAEDGVLATRELFDASPPMLKGFEPVRGFAF